MILEAAQRVIKFFVDNNLDSDGLFSSTSNYSQSRLISDRLEVGLLPLKCVSANIQKSIDNLIVLLK